MVSGDLSWSLLWKKAPEKTPNSRVLSSLPTYLHSPFHLHKILSLHNFKFSMALKGANERAQVGRTCSYSVDGTRYVWPLLALPYWLCSGRDNFF